ncbi:putative membrane protein [Loktanella sp. DSM 29012]|uniref:bestrophin family protein n=1 Tax=Loktanella sp. DSM 29012 TaxID=1881056 RepID=UPI0008BF3092|nr:bestrophin family ion channel [Loktanella sp. DSM 29012]SEQ83075.1 putative membrane protein [Loktanella sp. DSM 29012]
MIVKDQPSGWTLFFDMQGSVVPQIMPKIAGLAGFSVIVMALDYIAVPFPHVSLTALGVFGVALSLFLGFRNNAAYLRWWEGRTLWGGIIADVRSLAKSAEIFISDPSDRKDLLNCAVAFAHFHRSALRGVAVDDNVAAWIGAEDGVRLGNKANSTDAALRDMSRKIRHSHDRSGIDRFGQMTLARIVTSLGHHQAGCERIATTPLPFVYSLLVRRTTYLCCLLLPFALLEAAGPFVPMFVAVVAYVFFGLQAVTNQLEHPFRDMENGLPLDAMCRIVEISVAEATDRDPPAPLAAIDNVLK